MSTKILMNVTPMETRVALVESGFIQNIHIERTTSRSLVGNIYSGKVVRLVPGMQAAFVDIGLARTGFIHVSDVVVGTGHGRADKSISLKKIADHLHDGKKILVQVTRDPLGTKGARLTMHLSVSTRYLVLQPQNKHTGVSQRIDSPLEKARLKQMLAQARVNQSIDDAIGFVLRTAAEGVGLEQVSADIHFLHSVWVDISRSAKTATKVGLLYENLPLHLRTVRDLIDSSVEKILIDDSECLAALQDFCAHHVPKASSLLEHYSGELPLFELHGVEGEIFDALDRRVQLQCGGYLIFDQTEAMTVIDVNTGSFVGKRNQDDNFLKTNLEAVEVLARQLRLRNLGGIIIVDFINMEKGDHRRQVHDALTKSMQGDSALGEIAPFSKLGLIEMTRKRTSESLEDLLCEDCVVCHGRGVIKTAETVCCDIFRKIICDAQSCEKDKLMLHVAASVANRLLNEEAQKFSDLQQSVGKTISVHVELSYNQEHFDLIPF